jgi:hypothetical protein
LQLDQLKLLHQLRKRRKMIRRRRIRKNNQNQSLKKMLEE